MEYNNDFRYDLKVGQVGEKVLGDILEGTKLEVKTDLQAHVTGNVFVEYESRGKPSGIATSEADWYAFVLSDDNIILISKYQLKEIARLYFGTRRDIRGGDSNTSKGILIPIKELII